MHTTISHHQAHTIRLLGCQPDTPHLSAIVLMAVVLSSTLMAAGAMGLVLVTQIHIIEHRSNTAAHMGANRAERWIVVTKPSVVTPE